MFKIEHVIELQKWPRSGEGLYLSTGSFVSCCEERWGELQPICPGKEVYTASGEQEGKPQSFGQLIAINA